MDSIVHRGAGLDTMEATEHSGMHLIVITPTYLNNYHSSPLTQKKPELVLVLIMINPKR